MRDDGSVGAAAPAADRGGSAEPRDKLSPLLLVRDAAHARVVIADGYHRLCAVYGYDEDALIPCRIV